MFNLGDLVCDKAHTVVGVVCDKYKEQNTINVFWNKTTKYQGCKQVVLHNDVIELLPQGTRVTKHYKYGATNTILYNFYDSEKYLIKDITGSCFTACNLEFDFVDDVKECDDAVNHPSHYTQGNIEVIDYIEDKKLGYHLGNVVKYVSRAGHKNNALEDLKKARWYLNRKIKNMEEKDESN